MNYVKPDKIERESLEHADNVSLNNKGFNTATLPIARKILMQEFYRL